MPPLRLRSNMSMPVASLIPSWNFCVSEGVSGVISRLAMGIELCSSTASLGTSLIFDHLTNTIRYPIIIRYAFNNNRDAAVRFHLMYNQPLNILLA